MSKEQLSWLNVNTLIGFTDKRGTAWHYREALQGTEPNHYPQAIPVDDVCRRLFAWEAVERELYINVPCSLDDALTVAEAGGWTTVASDGQPYRSICVPDRKAIVTSDTNDVLGVFKDGYRPHQHKAWLVDNVSTILDDELGIGSAGLLRNRAQAWVSVEVPDTITTPEGVAFRPFLLAGTSFDGSLATTYKRCVQNVVCDNTLSAALSENGQTIKVKHSRNSDIKITDARDALALVYATGEDFAAEVSRLTSWAVTPKSWAALLDKLVPIPVSPGRAQTIASSRRDRLVDLYDHDNRVAPWAGTAFGVLQAFNTYEHHFANVRGASRPERNASNALLGVTERSDRDVLDALALIAV